VPRSTLVHPKVPASCSCLGEHLDRAPTFTYGKRRREILVSSLLRALVESSVGAAMFGAPREVELKGLSGTHVVFAVALV
jgi:hypothetical protein